MTERHWRTALLNLMAPSDQDPIVDFGTGTGTLCIGLKRRAPDCRLVGVDPDPKVLVIARAKAEASGSLSRFQGQHRHRKHSVGALNTEETPKLSDLWMSVEGIAQGSREVPQAGLRRFGGRTLVRDRTSAIERVDGDVARGCV